jgi:hypothetical protein
MIFVYILRKKKHNMVTQTSLDQNTAALNKLKIRQD